MRIIKSLFISLLAIIVLGFYAGVVDAHPGNTAADGCHYCRTNCDTWGVPWNERHCHRSKGIPQPSEPIRSHKGEPKGYTTPAPEYRIPVATSESNDAQESK